MEMILRGEGTEALGETGPRYKADDGEVWPVPGTTGLRATLPAARPVLPFPGK